MILAPTSPSPDLESILRRELLPAERLLWSASPAQQQLSVFWIWLFGIPWTAFCLFWEAMGLMPFFIPHQRAPDAMGSGFAILFPLFGVPFVAVGLGLLWAPFGALGKAGQTIYGLTDRRMLRVTAGKKRESSSVLFRQMGPIQIRVDTRGSGTLRIQTGTGLDSDGDQTISKFEVVGVPDVARLNNLLLEQLQQALYRDAGTMRTNPPSSR